MYIYIYIHRERKRGVYVITLSYVLVLVKPRGERHAGQFGLGRGATRARDSITYYRLY